LYICNAAGKLVGHAPLSPSAVDLQRAITKALSVPLTLQPPVILPAVHMLNVLAEAETQASAVAQSPKSPFITFTDTFAKYAELLTHRSGGAYLCDAAVALLSLP
jgi:hypothetical protein